TKDAQDSLRNTMEKYSSNCRFIMSCNYINKVNEAIQSRCSKFKFQLPEKQEIFDRIKTIVEKENVNISNDNLISLINKHYPDIRSIVVKLQSLHSNGKEITYNDINQEKVVVEEIFNKIKNGNKFSEIRQWILDSALDYKTVLVEMYNYVLENKNKFGKLTVTYINRIKECNRYLNMCVSQDIEFEYMIFTMIQDYKNQK
ncbi:MAG: hypothetical protein ACOCRX_03995, partial [Candidatus Woesearchaeota archaeon]